MNLRLLALLLLANSAYFAWSQGALAPLGLRPASQSEPERLHQQIKPQGLRAELPPANTTLNTAKGSAAAKPMPLEGATLGVSQPVPAR